MFSPDMPRALILLLVAITIASGCATAPSQQTANVRPNEVTSCPVVAQWLNLQQDVEKMSPEQVAERLAVLERPEGIGQQFYFGLLYQQLQTFDAWSQARDAFQKLQESDELAIEQRQLAGIFRQYNQNRINWYQRQKDLLVDHAQLQRQLDTAEQDKDLLQQKIKALTDLEAVISTRKEE